VADDRGVGQQKQWLGHERQECRHGQPKDLTALAQWSLGPQGFLVFTIADMGAW
jgi:hypothetical protein